MTENQAEQFDGERAASVAAHRIEDSVRFVAAMYGFDVDATYHLPANVLELLADGGRHRIDILAALGLPAFSRPGEVIERARELGRRRDRPAVNDWYGRTCAALGLGADTAAGELVEYARKMRAALEREAAPSVPDWCKDLRNLLAELRTELGVWDTAGPAEVMIRVRALKTDASKASENLGRWFAVCDVLRIPYSATIEDALAELHRLRDAVRDAEINAQPEIAAALGSHNITRAEAADRVAGLVRELAKARHLLGGYQEREKYVPHELLTAMGAPDERWTMTAGADFIRGVLTDRENLLGELDLMRGSLAETNRDLTAAREQLASAEKDAEHYSEEWRKNLAALREQTKRADDAEATLAAVYGALGSPPLITELPKVTVLAREAFGMDPLTGKRPDPAPAGSSAELAEAVDIGTPYFDAAYGTWSQAIGGKVRELSADWQAFAEAPNAEEYDPASYSSRRPAAGYPRVRLKDSAGMLDGFVGDRIGLDGAENPPREMIQLDAMPLGVALWYSGNDLEAL